MGGSAAFPLGPRPVSMNLTRPSSFQRPQRRPEGVRSGAVLCHLSIGWIGCRLRVAPFNHFVLSYSPFSILGEWQFWHCATSSTRYLPRAALSSAPYTPDASVKTPASTIPRNCVDRFTIGQ